MRKNVAIVLIKTLVLCQIEGEDSLRARLPVALGRGIDAVVHISQLPNHQRVVTSVREIVGAEGDLVASNEIYGPDDTGRAEPRYSFSAQRLARLEAAGFDKRWLGAHAGWRAA